MLNVSRYWKEKMGNLLMPNRQRFTPEAYVKLEYNIDGSKLTFDKSDLFDLRHTMSGDLNSLTLPENKIDFSIDNVDGRWNPDNPQGMYQKIAEKQEVDLYYGIDEPQRFTNELPTNLSDAKYTRLYPGTTKVDNCFYLASYPTPTQYHYDESFDLFIYHVGTVEKETRKYFSIDINADTRTGYQQIIFLFKMEYYDTATSSWVTVGNYCSSSIYPDHPHSTCYDTVVLEPNKDYRLRYVFQGTGINLTLTNIKYKVTAFDCGDINFYEPICLELGEMANFPCRTFTNTVNENPSDWELNESAYIDTTSHSIRIDELQFDTYTNMVSGDPYGPNWSITLNPECSVDVTSDYHFKIRELYHGDFIYTGTIETAGYYYVAVYNDHPRQILSDNNGNSLGRLTFSYVSQGEQLQVSDSLWLSSDDEDDSYYSDVLYFDANSQFQFNLGTTARRIGTIVENYGFSFVLFPCDSSFPAHDFYDIGMGRTTSPESFPIYFTGLSDITASLEGRCNYLLGYKVKANRFEGDGYMEVRISSNPTWSSAQTYQDTINNWDIRNGKQGFFNFYGYSGYSPKAALKCKDIQAIYGLELVFFIIPMENQTTCPNVGLGQSITSDLPYQIGYTKAGTFYMSGWDTPQNGLTATFTATSLIDMMNTKFDKTGLLLNTNLKAIAEHAFSQSALPLGPNSTPKWHVDNALASYTLTLEADSLDMTCAEVVQLVANAGNCVIRIDEDGDVWLHSVEMVDVELSDYTIDLFTSYSYPEYKLSSQLKNVVFNDEFDITIDTQGVQQDIKNELIDTLQHAQTNAGWLGSVIGTRKTISGEYRSDPRLQIYDYVKSINTFAVNELFITSLTYTYNGSFKAIYEGRVMKSISNDDLHGNYYTGDTKTGGQW